MAVVTPNTCGSPLGRMVAVRAPNAAPVSVTFDGINPQSLGLCTQLLIDQQVIAQFQNTFDDYIYITPFGDKPGAIVLSFIINKSCPETVAAFNAIDFYVQRRLRPSYLGVSNNTVVLFQSTPIIVAINSLTLRGFVTGLKVDASTAQWALVSAQLLMTGWPI